MTITQITALLGLLLAFGVDQPTISRVQAILTQAPSAIVKPMDTQKEEQPKEEVTEEVVAPTPSKDEPKIDPYGYPAGGYNK